MRSPGDRSAIPSAFSSYYKYHQSHHIFASSSTSNIDPSFFSQCTNSVRSAEYLQPKPYSQKEKARLSCSVENQEGKSDIEEEKRQRQNYLESLKELIVTLKAGYSRKNIFRQQGHAKFAQASNTMFVI